MLVACRLAGLSAMNATHRRWYQSAIGRQRRRHQAGYFNAARHWRINAVHALRCSITTAVVRPCRRACIAPGWVPPLRSVLT
jgi:hypothetical protein